SEVGGRSGSFCRRVIGEPPGKVVELAGYPAFTGMATPMTSDPIVPVELDEEFASGEVGGGFTDPSFSYPTTIASYEGRLLVVNAQFDERGGNPEFPFTVSDIQIPQ
ncbi:MAG: hypothetical protein M3494_10525, partial [Actinomycetota bacterium]|nr:hypothetical protein [Actinomycetota bacterium]